MSLVVQGPGGTVTVPEAVLAEIAVKAAESVEGVRVRRRRSVDIEARVVRIGIAAPAGEALVSVGERVQKQVAEAIGGMTGLDVGVDVTVEELR